MIYKLFWIVIFGVLPLAMGLRPAATAEWKDLETGLQFREFEAPLKSEYGDSRITVLKIDPNYFEIDIYCASQYEKKQHTAREWAEEFELVATVNAGMYATDHLTAVGFMKSDSHLNNSYLNKNYKTVFACNPINEKIAPVKIIDLVCENISEWQEKYRSFSQSIRMISCKQRNVWQQQPNKWSIAALAMDQSGDLLMIHSRSPYSVHDFINMLLQLPLNIYNAMYLEGGPEASLFFKSGKFEKELIGSFETGFLMNNSNTKAWPIPNVIGVKSKAQ